MAPKAKPKKAEGDSDAWEEFMKRYNKNQKEYDTPKIPDVLEIVRRTEEDGEVLAWNFSSEFDPMAFRVLFHTLAQAQYIQIEAIRVWKCGGGDESVRSVCHYLDMPEPQPNCKDLQFLDNGVTALGCEFLGKTLGPNGNKMINLLRLDYNPFGTAGVEKLSMGLSQNGTLRHLSLNYCAIGEDGGQYIAHILMFISSAVEKLELKGNYLRERGVVDVFNGARRAKTLQEIDVFDNKFSDTHEVIEALRDLFANNTNIKRYNLGGNQISDAGSHALVNGMIGQTHLQAVSVTERCSAKTFEAIEEIVSAKKKKGKKKK